MNETDNARLLLQAQVTPASTPEKHCQTNQGFRSKILMKNRESPICLLPVSEVPQTFTTW
jgi:hypothetical protein